MLYGKQRNLFRMPFDNYAAALAFGKRTQFLKIIRAEQQGTARRTALRLA